MSKYVLCTNYRDLFLDSEYIKGRKKSKNEAWKFIVDYKVDGVRKQQRINTHKSDKSQAKQVRDETLEVLLKEPHRIHQFGFKRNKNIDQHASPNVAVIDKAIVYQPRYHLDMPLYEAFQAYRKRRESDITIERRTVKSINDIFLRHVIPYFQYTLPDLQVKDTVLEHFLDYFNMQLSVGIGGNVVTYDSNQKIKKYSPLTPQTIKKHSTYLSTALDEIISCDPRNNSHLLGVVSKLRENARKYSTQREKEAVCLTTVEDERIISYVQQNLYQSEYEKINVENIVVYLGLKFALRCSEAISLRWSDIDFEKKLLRVVNSRDIPDDTKNNSERSNFQGVILNGELFKTPKSKAGRREIPFNNDIMKDLLRFKEVQDVLESMLDDGNGGYYIEGKPFVCRFADGSIMAARHPIECLQDILQRTNSTIIRQGNPVALWFHELRHTCITRWMGSGIPHVKVQKMSGHSTITALEIYTHHENIDVIEDYHRIYGE